MKTFFYDRNVIASKFNDLEEWALVVHEKNDSQKFVFSKETGLSSEEIKTGLSALEREVGDLSHPIAKAKMIQYVMENTRIAVDEHDWFVGFCSISRMAQAFTQDKWWEEMCRGELKKGKGTNQ